ncbi:MAG TPA: hypothetical protein VFN24_08625 [Microbacterium sp.]|nr:hypothetical protein [Microbacterium sp.]
MNRTPQSLALTMKDAAKLVGVDYRTIKQGIDNGTIPTVQLGPPSDDPPLGLAARLRRRGLTGIAGRHANDPLTGNRARRWASRVLCATTVTKAVISAHSQIDPAVVLGRGCSVMLCSVAL